MLSCKLSITTQDFFYILYWFEKNEEHYGQQGARLQADGRFFYTLYWFEEGRNTTDNGGIEVTSTEKVRKDISGEDSFEFQKIKLPILSSFALSIP